MKKLPVLLTLSLILAACGNASQTTSTPTAGTTPVAQVAQVVTGTITSLSADHQTLVVAGQTLKLSVLGTQSLGAQASATRVKVNGDDVNPLALSVGEHVTVQATGEVAGVIEIQKELRGVIGKIDLAAGTLTISGQMVQVLASTRIELSRQESSTGTPAHTLAELKEGSFAEVTGTRDAAGGLTASSIEIRSSTERQEQGQDDEAELHGTVSALDASARTFTALGAHVDYAQATVTGTLTEGSQVEVKGTYDEATSTLTASRVQVGEGGEHGQGDGAPAAGTAIRLEEKVKTLDLTAKTLVAGKYTADFSGAKIDGTPAVGAEVRISGQLDAADATLIHATDVRFKTED